MTMNGRYVRSKIHSLTKITVASGETLRSTCMWGTITYIINPKELKQSLWLTTSLCATRFCTTMNLEFQFRVYKHHCGAQKLEWNRVMPKFDHHQIFNNEIRFCKIGSHTNLITIWLFINFIWTSFCTESNRNDHVDMITIDLFIDFMVFSLNKRIFVLENVVTESQYDIKK